MADDDASPAVSLIARVVAARLTPLVVRWVGAGLLLRLGLDAQAVNSAAAWAIEAAASLLLLVLAEVMHACRSRRKTVPFVRPAPAGPPSRRSGRTST